MTSVKGSPGRLAAALTVVLVLAGCGRTVPPGAPAPSTPATAATPATPGPGRVRLGEGSTYVAVATTDVTARSTPGGGRIVGLFPKATPWGSPTPFLVKQAYRNATGETWLQVLLPRRPNELIGWVRRDQVRLRPVVHRLEGYWGGTFVGRLLAHLLIRRQERQQNRLVDARAITHPSGKLRASLAEQREQTATERLEHYPDRDRLLATRLGNILRAAEDRAGNRYGFGAVTVWPRLYPLVSGRLAGILLEHRHQLDVATRFCVTLVIDAALVAGLLAPYGRWTLLSLVPLALAWLSYRAALAAAVAYGVTVEATFDLYRFELLKALHLPLPPDGASERRLNEIVSEFLQRGDGWTLSYPRRTGVGRRRGDHPLAAARHQPPPPAGDA